MKWLKYILVFFGNISLAYAIPQVNTAYTYYMIQGQSALVLQQQMAKLGPVDINAEHFAASTSWHVQWSYQYEMLKERCAIKQVALVLDVVYRFPAWKNEMQADQGLRFNWGKFIQGLHRHEKGHANHGVHAAEAIEYALKRLPAAENCEALTEAADQTAYQIVAEYNTKDTIYENATQHGALQGAVLPLR